MILFTGTLEKGYYISEIAENYKQEVELAEKVSYHISDIKDRCLIKKYDYIIIDTDNFIDDSITIGEDINSIRLTSNAQIIVMATGAKEGSELIQILHEKGFKYFITSPILGTAKNQLISALNGIEMNISKFENPDISDMLPESAKLDTVKQTVFNKRKYNIISIAGCCHRIGTTTQAIQIIKYLTSQNKKACYIEMNDSNYIKEMISLYGLEYTDTSLGLVRYQNTDMFCKKERIAEILKQDYDFYIYDCGCFSDKSFNAVSYYEKDITIAVCGSKPNEFVGMHNLISCTINADILYTFTFTPDTEKDDLLEVMEDKAQQTFFSPYVPDMFSYSSESNELYKKMLTVDSVNIPEKRKFSFFKRG